MQSNFRLATIEEYRYRQLSNLKPYSYPFQQIQHQKMSPEPHVLIIGAGTTGLLLAQGLKQVRAHTHPSLTMHAATDTN